MVSESWLIVALPYVTFWREKAFLEIPSFLKGKSQLSSAVFAKSCLSCLSDSCGTVKDHFLCLRHIDCAFYRAIGRVKEFHLLASVQPMASAPDMLNDYVTIACGLTNLQAKLLYKSST